VLSVWVIHIPTAFQDNADDRQPTTVRTATGSGYASR